MVVEGSTKLFLHNQLSNDIHAIFAAHEDGSSVTVGQILDRVSTKGFGIFLAVLSLPSALPVPAPGYSIPFGIVLLVLGASFSNHTGITPKKPLIQVDRTRTQLAARPPLMTVPERLKWRRRPSPKGTRKMCPAIRWKRTIVPAIRRMWHRETRMIFRSEWRGESRPR